MVKKSTCERYDIRTGNFCEWASIVVSDDGQVQVQSDFGTWSYWWSHHGCESIKHFLVKIDTWYLIEKFGGHRTHFNPEKTIEAIKAEILRQQKDGELDDTKWTSGAKNLVECAMVDLDQACPMSADDLANTFEYSAPLSYIFRDPCDIPVVMEPDPGLVNFSEKIWPLFVNALKEELCQKI